MKVLIINTNTVVQKLIEMTTRKMHIENLVLANLEDLTMVKNLEEYQFAVIDDGVLKAENEENLKLLEGMHTCLLFSKENQRIGDFDFTIKKPFLPNELLNILVSLRVEETQEAKPQAPKEPTPPKEPQIESQPKVEAQKAQTLQVEETQETPKIQTIQKPKPLEFDFQENVCAEVLENFDEDDEGLHHILDGIESGLLQQMQSQEQEKNQEQEIKEILQPKQESQEVLEQQDLIAELQQHIQQEEAQKETQKQEEEGTQIDQNDISQDNVSENNEAKMGLDENEIMEIKDLLMQTQAPKKQENNALTIIELLQRILQNDESSKKLQEMLEGMQIDIQISFSKKDS